MARTNSNNDSPKGADVSKRKFSQSQYDMLKRCSDAKDMTEWNDRRKTKSDKYICLNKVNLEGADLEGEDLRGADLREADLRGADLREADLSGANNIWTNLEGADLTGADLRRANLSEANLEKVNLSGANLEGANLRRANLDRAKLIEANLKGADLYRTHLRKADMRSAIFTPEGEPIGKASFLDLSSCIDVETAKFSETNFLQEYLARAFEFAHKPGIHESKEWPRFLQEATDSIKALRALFADQQLPKQLIKVVGVITTELIKYLKKHPKAMYQIRPRQFEELIAEILTSYGWEVQLTPPIKDGGYDIFAVKKNIKPGVETSWIIECKKYAPENKVGVDIVRSLYGVKAQLSGVANVLLATTSYFTKGAQDFKASRYDIELKDYSNILEWINEYRPNPNGRLYIKDNKLIVPGDE